MIFLKKFTAIGFKSFADGIEINFDKPMTGIVGPNGSGKSNIVDALKWVLGERSLKQLRGKNSEDIIFFGSHDKKPSMFAEVKLYFDNSLGALHSDEKEVVISRKIHRGSGLSEYFINGRDATLKDITNIFLDTGLAKGSLGIISQGTISWFVEAKPEDRRTIFEEAAGIGRYTKKKTESLADLERTDKNLREIDSVINVLTRDLKNIGKQAERAKIFLEKKEKLKDIELTVLVHDYLTLSDEINKIESVINESNTELKSAEPEIVQLESLLKISWEKYNIADKNISEIQLRLQEIFEETSQLNQRQMLIEQKLINSLSSDKKSIRESALAQKLKALNFELSEHYRNIRALEEIVVINQEKVVKINEEIKSLNDTFFSSSSQVQNLKEQISFLSEYKASDLAKEHGVQTILNNLDSLRGISGLVQNLIKVTSEYEKAIAVALGKAMKFFVTVDTDSALRAIDFLKENKAGKATFLPLDNITPRIVRQDHLLVAQQIDGFVGIAADLVECDKLFLPAIRHLLGSTIISSDFASALRISNFTFQNYRVISLDQQIVHVAGAISGGSDFKTATILNIDKNIENLKKEHTDLTNEIHKTKVKLEEKQSDVLVLTDSLQSKKISLQNHNNLVEKLRMEIQTLSIEYENLTGRTFDGKKVVWNQDKIQKKSIKLTQEKDELNESLRVNKQIKEMHSAQINENERKINELRSLVNSRKNLLLNENNIFADKKNRVTNVCHKIVETYRLTVDNAVKMYNKELPCSEKEARNLIVRLQSDLDNLGSINLDAINDIKQIQQQHDDYQQKRSELQKARDELQEVINELDNKARLDFQSLIDQLNEVLPETFQYLFGGGTCQIRYNDPNEDILVTGIDVFANPLGKNVSNLNLLSGGEKTLVALSVLFAILKISAFPLVIFDEAESALDPMNVERFANIIRSSTDNTQFIVITHRQGTMVKCNKLLGATMHVKGVTKMYSVTLENASEFVSETSVK